MNFTTRLNEALSDKNWRSVQLCAALADRGTNVHISTVEKWLNGTNEPRIATARLIADVLGIPMDELVPLPNETAIGR